MVYTARQGRVSYPNDWGEVEAGIPERCGSRLIHPTIIEHAVPPPNMYHIEIWVPVNR